MSNLPLTFSSIDKLTETWNHWNKNREDKVETRRVVLEDKAGKGKADKEVKTTMTICLIEHT